MQNWFFKGKDHINLNIDGKAIIAEKEKEKREKVKFLILSIISALIAVSGLALNLAASYYRLMGSIEPFAQGSIIGAMIGTVLLLSMIWYVIWRWAKQNNKGTALAIISLCYLLAAAFVNM